MPWASMSATIQDSFRILAFVKMASVGSSMLYEPSAPRYLVEFVAVQVATKDDSY